MKFLQDYREEKQTELFKRTNSFFAFSQKQFDEGRKEGLIYVSLGAGMICEKGQVKTLLEGLDKIEKEAIQEDVKENGKRAIIMRELGNYECWYSGDIEDAYNELKRYGYTLEEVEQVYREERIKEIELREPEFL